MSTQLLQTPKKENTCKFHTPLRLSPAYTMTGEKNKCSHLSTREHSTEDSSEFNTDMGSSLILTGQKSTKEISLYDHDPKFPDCSFDFSGKKDVDPITQYQKMSTNDEITPERQNFQKLCQVNSPKTNFNNNRTDPRQIPKLVFRTAPKGSDLRAWRSTRNLLRITRKSTKLKSARILSSVGSANGAIRYQFPFNPVKSVHSRTVSGSYEQKPTLISTTKANFANNSSKPGSATTATGVSTCTTTGATAKFSSATSKNYTYGWKPSKA
jgi:hypothetical protein